jgi:hypothetical protein
MINIKKGNGLTLQQADKAFAFSEAITAGATVGILSTGVVAKCDSAVKAIGFALSDSTTGDVKESGKLPVLFLDGGSVIETDQYDTSLTYTVGAAVYAYAAGTTAGSRGLLTNVSSSNTIVGTLLGFRTLPIAESSVTSTSQAWVNAAGTSITTSGVKPGFQTATFMEVKLGANIVA